jgi:hypothetical protein
VSGASSLFDRNLGPVRFYLSRGCWGRPGLALWVGIRHRAVILFAPYIEPADLWVGLYHREVRYADGFSTGRDFWFCPIPCLVLKFHIRWPRS